MNIEFNDFFRLRVDVTKVRGDQYRLVMERVYLDDCFHSSKDEYFMTKQQLGQLVDFLKDQHDAIE